jgi:glycosyltransferase involved in cell wall biosynthesis
MERVPKVSIGLPVWNGENYLAEAIGSVLRQGFADFELLISDNASTDRTPEIIARFAAQDPRIRWERQDRNRGAAWNYDRTFAMSRAPYFKWLAHDDLVGDTFLAGAVALLDAAPEFVGAIPATMTIIDAAGQEIGQVDNDMDPPGLGPAGRLGHLLRQRSFHCNPFFGLFRRGAMLTSDLHGNYGGSDRVFVGEMLLRGRISHLPQARGFFRHHPEQFSLKIFGDAERVQEWLTTERRQGLSRTLRLRRGYVAAVGRSGLHRAERLRAYAVIGRMLWAERCGIARELAFSLLGPKAGGLLARAAARPPTTGPGAR